MGYAPQYRLARQFCEMSQAQAAERLGVAASTLSGWETGSNDPTASQLVEMSRLYGFTSDQLIGLEPLVVRVSREEA